MTGTISSWVELQAFLAASGRTVRVIKSDALSFALAPGSSRRLQARAVRFPSGSTWLSLSLQVCARARLRLRGALVANAELPVGGLALADEDVILRQTLPLVQLGAAELEHAIRALGATADALAAALAAAGVPDSEQPFAYAFR